MPLTPVDPVKWLETLDQTLKAYAVSKLDPLVYDVVMEFPPAEILNQKMPLNKTLIHFANDHVENDILGLGERGVDVIEDDSVPTEETVSVIEASEHKVNYDVGIWASDNSGGPTARNRAYQRVHDMFYGAGVRLYLQETLGFEIVHFTGGMNAREKINDIPVFRTLGIELVIRVFGKKVNVPIPMITDIGQDADLTIDSIELEIG